MRNLGVFDEISGLAIGRTDNWSDDDVALLDQLVLDAVRGTDVPVIAGVEVTHSTPLLTVPIGIPGSIRGLDLSIDESAVR